MYIYIYIYVYLLYLLLHVESLLYIINVSIYLEAD